MPPGRSSVPPARAAVPEKRTRRCAHTASSAPALWLMPQPESGPMPQPEERSMRDYWLSKMFYDLQNPALAAEYRAERDQVLDRYRIGPEVRKALAENDVPFLAQRTNAYLLRYAFFAHL